MVQGEPNEVQVKATDGIRAVPAEVADLTSQIASPTMIL